jgi:hypothetical protein
MGSINPQGGAQRGADIVGGGIGGFPQGRLAHNGRSEVGSGDVQLLQPAAVLVGNSGRGEK